MRLFGIFFLFSSSDSNTTGISNIKQALIEKELPLQGSSSKVSLVRD